MSCLRALRRRRVSSTATGRWLPSFLFTAVSEARAIQETTSLGCGNHDATHAVEGPHSLVPVPWDEPCLDVLRADPTVLQPILREGKERVLEQKDRVCCEGDWRWVE